MSARRAIEIVAGVVVAARCCTCREMKPRHEFGNTSSGTPKNRCKACCAAAQRRYFRKNATAILERLRTPEARAIRSEAQRARWWADPERARARERNRYERTKNVSLKWRRAGLAQYGLSLEAYNALRDSQGNACAICCAPFTDVPPKAIHVDHDHATGVVRGILCDDCNIGLGRFRDDASLLSNAIEYLARARALRAS